jgi:hypothetical protein
MSRSSIRIASLRIVSSLFLVVLGSLGALASCGGGSAGTKEDFIASYCDKLSPCCEQAGLPSNGAQCKQFLGLFATGTYDPKAGEACLAAIDASSTFCDDGNAPECQGVFSSASGSVKPGGECSSTSDCAPSAEGTVDCAFAFSSSGGQIQKCQVQIDGKAGDSPCVGTKDGNTTSFISAQDVAPKGYICDVANKLFCDQDTTKCTATRAVGDACTGSASECGADAFCDFASQKCAARLAAGSPCSGSDSCKSGTYCDFDTMTCTTSIPDGSACTSGEKCLSNSCVNGKCASNTSGGLSLLCGGN